MIDASLQALLWFGAAVVRVGRGGKTPFGKAWHTAATTDADTVDGWLRGGYNLGLLCGVGNLVDVEYDDATGRDAMDRAGLFDIHTPTWTSGRGQHRLFRLLGPVPPWGWRKVNGYEVRLGGKPAQSVLPPSVHPTGVGYRWIVSPLECVPAAVRLGDLGIMEVCK